MRQAQFLRGGLGGFLVVWTIGSLGCTHNHYYGYGTSMPVCGPTAAIPSSTISSGSVCEVPSQISGGTVISQGNGGTTIADTTPIYGASPAPRVVVSEPRGSRFSRWRPSNPDSSVATTRVEGGTMITR